MLYETYQNEGVTLADKQFRTNLKPYTFYPLGKIWKDSGYPGTPHFTPIAEVYGECMPGAFSYAGRAEDFAYLGGGANRHGEAYNSESYLAEIGNFANLHNSKDGWGVLVYGYCVEFPDDEPNKYSVSLYPYMGTVVEKVGGYNRDFATFAQAESFARGLNLQGLTHEYLLAQGFTYTAEG